MAKDAEVKSLFIHIGIIIAILIVMTYGFFYLYLPSITHHGEHITVPDLSKKSLAEIEEIINASNLRFVINDSAYTPKVIPLTVINQYPKAGEKVKSNRTIYISVSSKNPPGVKMPKLVGNSLKAAEMSLKSYGLILGTVTYKPSANVGAVLEQSVNGVKIGAESAINKGTVVNLTVGNGLGNAYVEIPCLTTIELSEAKNIILSQGLELGIISYEENSDEPRGVIFKQRPICTPEDSLNKIKTGQIIDLWISGKNPETN